MLIHIDPTTGPIGAWTIQHGQPVAHYPDAQPAAQERARGALANKGDAVGWDYWFRRLAYRSPYLDDYEVITVPDDLALADAFHGFLTGWAYRQP